ncbi:MAG: aminodeoxychorismate synthase component I [Lentisphaeria bacterium]|nr:aminodeoxychorismate synthase component I [Lentisphaeria bacterium]
MNTVILRDNANAAWVCYREPVDIVSAQTLAEVLPALERLDRAVRDGGMTAAGFVSYEAAPAFDPALVTRPAADLPLLWFGLFRRPDTLPSLDHAVADGAGFSLGPWLPSVSRDAYEGALAAIRQHLAAGDTYQVNFTFRLRAAFGGNPLAWFAGLAPSQPSPYAAYVDTGRFAICSVSPELFFELQESRIVSRPMKGTMSRGRTPAEDRARAKALRQCPKNRAENLMIVDMIRNDIGRVAIPGSVRVPRLFHVERYPTVLQMTSTVEALTNAAFPDILAALFPCASITGAPKPKTMAIIAALEDTPRGLYCGCVGCWSGRRARFSVAIRTAVVDRSHGNAEYGVGGGIVWDSIPSEEYEECRIKARVLGEPRPPFSLLETMLWEPEQGVFLLDLHLRRILESARYFGIPLAEKALRKSIGSATAGLPRQSHRLRLLAGRDGALRLEALPFAQADPDAPVRLRWARKPIDPIDPFLSHKTTYRILYEQARASRQDCDDVLLWNPRGEATESTIANLVIERRGRLVTPPVESGLLPGTFRHRLLEQGEIAAEPVTVTDVHRAPRLFLVNSLRKWRPAVMLDDEPPFPSAADPT